MSIEQKNHPLSTIEDAVSAFQAGRMVIIVDDEDRENEGDLTIPAEKITPEAINFMAREGRGLICLAMTEERCRELDLPPMVEDNTSSFGTAFTVSIEAKARVSTGISAHDRAETVRTAIDPASGPSDLARPGHIFPIAARPGGVLHRAGQTEASVDLARISGLQPAAVICEIMKDDGTMARLPDLVEFAERHQLPIITTAELIRHRMGTERIVRRVAGPTMPSVHGDFRVMAYESTISGEQHLALVRGELDADDEVLVRVHSQCLTGDVFGSLRCDCGDQLQKALEMIDQEGKGVLLYLLQEGRGIGLFNKLRAYELQDDRGIDTVEANVELGFPPDIRDYGIGCQILRDIGVRKMRLLTNNPSKYVALGGYGLEIVERVPIEIPPESGTRKYLEAKKKKLGHLLKMV